MTKKNKNFSGCGPKAGCRTHRDADVPEATPLPAALLRRRKYVFTIGGGEGVGNFASSTKHNKHTTDTMENTLDEGRTAAIYGGSVKAPETPAAISAAEPPAATEAPKPSAATEAPEKNDTAGEADPLAEAEERGPCWHSRR